MNNQKGFANIVLIAVVVIFVGVVGYFAFVKKSEPAVQQPTPTPTQTNSLSPTQTAGWKMYTNSQYGFEVKYPSEWKYSENENPNENKFFVCLDPSTNTACSGGGGMIEVIWKTTLDAQYKTIQPRYAAPYDYQKTAVVISGETAQQFTSDNPEAISKAVFLNHGAYVYGFILNWNSVVLPHKDTLNQILSTFKFIN